MSKKDVAAEAAGKKKDESKQGKPSNNIEELILDYETGKYSAIPLAAVWAKELRRREEHRHLTSNEILELALKEVLSGKIDWKDLKKLIANGHAAAEEEKAKK